MSQSNVEDSFFVYFVIDDHVYFGTDENENHKEEEEEPTT